jgi:hypothetical protein
MRPVAIHNKNVTVNGPFGFAQGRDYMKITRSGRDSSKGHRLRLAAAMQDAAGCKTNQIIYFFR